MPSDRRTRVVRFLRIAVSGVCMIVCVLLVGLWVRSYGTLDQVRVGKTAIASMNGRLIVNDVFNISTTQPELMESYSQYTLANDRITIWTARNGALIPVGVGKSIPGWPLVVAALAVAVVPWIPWSRHFSLRTLLIATTLIAVVLGLAVYAAR